MISSAKGAFRPSGNEDGSQSKGSEDDSPFDGSEGDLPSKGSEVELPNKKNKAFGTSMAENEGKMSEMAENEGKLKFPLPIIGDVNAAIKMNLFYHFCIHCWRHIFYY